MHWRRWFRCWGYWISGHRSRRPWIGGQPLTASQLLSGSKRHRWRWQRQHSTRMGVKRQLTAGHHTHRFTGLHAHAACLGTHLDFILLPGHHQFALVIESHQKGRAANAHHRRGRGDLVVLWVAFADQAGHSAHAASQQADRKILLGWVAGVGVAGHGKLRIRVQRHQAAIRETDLRAAARTRHDHVAAFHLGPFRGGGHHRPSAQLHIPRSELHGPGCGQPLHGPGGHHGHPEREPRRRKIGLLHHGLPQNSRRTVTEKTRRS